MEPGSGARVLVTGGTGAFGTAVVEHLLRDGADVVALARRRPARVPAGVRFIPGDVRDPETVEKAMAGCDAVAHLAWVVSLLLPPDETNAINIEGTRNVLRAMERTGCGRLVFASSVMVYGSHADHPHPYQEDEPTIPDPRFLYATHKVEIERLIRESGANAVLARVAPVLGRDVENAVSHVFTAPVIGGIKGADMRFQMVHQEDVGRFLASACLGGPTGVVNLAPDDSLTIEEIGELSRRRVLKLRPGVARAMLKFMHRFRMGEVDPVAMDALRYMPLADTTRLKETFDFRCAWTTSETVLDMARSGSRYVYLGVKRLDTPWRLKYSDPSIPPDVPPLDDGELVPAGPLEHAGEFDSLIDPRYPEYSATNLSEAFPGPMTPLSLHVSMDAMRASAHGVAMFLGMGGKLGHELTVRGVAVFGNRVYVNLTAARSMALSMPASSPEEFDHQFLGAPLPDGFKPHVGARDSVRALGLLRRLLPRIAGFEREVARAESEAERLAARTASLDAMSDERLLAYIRLLHDELSQVWTVACVANIIASGAAGLAERVAGEAAAGPHQQDLGDLASAGALLGVCRLADLARSDPDAAEVLRSVPPTEALAALRARAPEFAAEVDALLATYGHRGPSETELENPTFSDAPWLLLDAIAKAMLAPDPRPKERRASRRGRRAVAMAARVMQRRERARDGAIKITHALRLAARERGRRLVTADVLDDLGLVFYLTYDELFAPPTDARAVVARRRAERERLRGIRLPLFFDGRWDPETDVSLRLQPGEELTGLAASAGTARGRVRVVQAAALDLEPGDVLVAQLTDTGWTPLFAYAAAIVTDLGGMMSHAAVVAREYGIPSVVGTRQATARLRDGQMVEVDGAAGVVRALD